MKNITRIIYTHFGIEPAVILHHNQHIVPDYLPNMKIINLFFSEISQQTHKMYEQMATITQILHRAKCYFTCIGSGRCLITIADMNKINIFSSKISQQTHSKLRQNGNDYSKRYFERNFPVPMLCFYIMNKVNIPKRANQTNQTNKDKKKWIVLISICSLVW